MGELPRKPKEYYNGKRHKAKSFAYISYVTHKSNNSMSEATWVRRNEKEKEREKKRLEEMVRV